MDRNAWLRSGDKNHHRKASRDSQIEFSAPRPNSKMKTKIPGRTDSTGAALAFVDRDKLLPHRRADIGAQRAIEPVIGELFEHVSRPSAGSRDSKDGSKHVRGNAKRIIDCGRVEIDVGIETLFLL